MTEADIGVWMAGFTTGFGVCAVLGLTIYLITDWLVGRRGDESWATEK